MKTKRFTEVCQLDTCLPDYFTGYHMPVVAIPVYNGMTNKDIAEAIQSEINSSWEYLQNDDHGFTEKEMKLFDTFCNKLKREKTRIIVKGFEEPEDDDQEIESPYMYLSLCKPVHKYGMTFLNE
jgi:hypothetical protein